MPVFKTKLPFIWSRNEEGLFIRFSDLRRYQAAKAGRAAKFDQIGYIRMQMLLESGEADVQEIDHGIFIAKTNAVRLDDETREGFALPSPWPGGMRLETDLFPQSPNFNARLALVDADASAISDWRLSGPILEANNENYLPSAAQFAALAAYVEWKNEPNKDELSNLSMLATLREAWKKGCRIYQGTYDDTIIANANDFFLDVREEDKSGDLILRPVVSGDFPDLDADKIEKCLAQLNIGDDRTVLRVGETIVLLNPEQTRLARAAAARGKVPRNQREEFEKNPSWWLSEHVFPDVETEFSPRVIGVGVWKGGYLGANWESGEDWFGKQPEIKKKTDKKTAKDTSETSEAQDESDAPDLEDKDQEQLVPLIIPNDEELGFGWRFPGLASENDKPMNLDFTRYARTPYPYQEDAVRWLLGNARRALTRSDKPGNENDGYGAGALLADDMGLGKTFSTLIFIAEWFQIWRNTTGKEPPAVLIVAPLSLLENWKAEIQKSFLPDTPVFKRVLIAQRDAELDKVRGYPGSHDIATPGQVKEYGLCFGDGTERSIDFPGSCLMTTYQTLREYRFSFAKSEWSAVVFDEAQYIKNPNALQTISAKALKSIFRTALTGTPVENHLGDFWCILDTVEPGPLGSFSEFKKNWILPMKQAPDKISEIGKKLQNEVDGLLLRRTKEEKLEGLPQKTVKTVNVKMPDEQAAIYDAAITAVKSEQTEEYEDAKQRRNRQLAALWQLRQVSLHPDLLGDGKITNAKSAKTSRAILRRSGKLDWMMKCLDEIQGVKEKVLIFCVQKKLQEALSFHLGQIYYLLVPVINGDTKAASRRNPEKTRLGLIEKFSNQPGFGICILSPIAAGAGLNIVAANHVIHLERHWNPAKEDQATDRVYRIGQSRPVSVYLPIGIHPRMDSFDLVLNRLLEKKRALQGALGLIPPEKVSGPEILDEVFGGSTIYEKNADFIDIHSALKLSWRHFEALIAVIYQNNAKRVILTPAGSDRGCDVVVLDFEKSGDNLLIQCKMTSKTKLNGDKAIREIEGARPFYEKALGLKSSFGPIQNRRGRPPCLPFRARAATGGRPYGTDPTSVWKNGQPWERRTPVRPNAERGRVTSFQ